VSVVIPTFNRSEPVQRALRSVLAQTCKDYELIVVDDGSTDSTLEELQKFGSSLMILSQERRGVSAARNLGISESRGSLIAFLDSDDEWRPEKLSRQIETFRKAPAKFCCHTDELWLRNGREVPQKPIHRKQGGFFFERSLERCLISPSSVIMSKDLLEEVGLFDETLEAAEDYDLWLRITAFHRVEFIPERLLIKHGGRDDQLSETVPAIDRFRIKAILKTLQNPLLKDDYRCAAIRVLIRKCEIMATGCRKRSRQEEAQIYLELVESHKKLLNQHC
jgi:glycosyltransferase involved in cell wall biosynthesis